jgi:hypothetical protein
MLVNQLKEELKSRGSSTIGKKAELTSRLLDLIAMEEKESNQQQEVADLSESPVISSSVKAEDSVVAPLTSIEETTVVAVASDEPNPSVELESGEIVEPTNHVNIFERDAIFVEKPTDMDAAEASVDTKLGYTHVRIDNFQRPLTQKALLDWLEAQCQCKVSVESLWINTIKTHCYVDFESEAEARRCVETVTGKKFPASSPYLLEADFTSVSAKEAPQSAEGALKPGSWKVPPAPTALPQQSQKQQRATKAPPASTIPQHDASAHEVMDTQDHNPVKREAGNPHKRKLDESTSSIDASAAATGETPSNKSRRVASLDIFRKAAAGILFNRTGVSAPPTVYEAPIQTSSSPSASRQRHLSQGEEEAAPDEQTNAATAAAEGSSLDDLFRKTVVALPSLYWLPAPSEVVQQRLKSRLMARSPRSGR